MDFAIVAVYTICDDFLIAHGHQEHPLAKMSDVDNLNTQHDKIVYKNVSSIPIRGQGFADNSFVAAVF